MIDEVKGLRTELLVTCSARERPRPPGRTDSTRPAGSDRGRPRTIVDGPGHHGGAIDVLAVGPHLAHHRFTPAGRLLPDHSHASSAQRVLRTHHTDPQGADQQKDA